MNGAIGYKLWAIAVGQIPGSSTGSESIASHETVDFLNPSNAGARAGISVFLSVREAIGPYRVTVLARRTLPVWLSERNDLEAVAHDTAYASAITSSVPTVVHYSRLDSRQGTNALLDTVAFALTQEGGSV